MAAVISLGALNGGCSFLDGGCYFRSFLVGSGWLLSFPGGLLIVVIPWWALNGCCYFLAGSGWWLLFPGGLWMVVVISGISWWALDGCYYFVLGSGWLLLFPGGLWMVPGVNSSTAQPIFTILLRIFAMYV